MYPEYWERTFKAIELKNKRKKILSIDRIKTKVNSGFSRIYIWFKQVIKIQ